MILVSRAFEKIKTNTYSYKISLFLFHNKIAEFHLTLQLQKSERYIVSIHSIYMETIIYTLNYGDVRTNFYWKEKSAYYKIFRIPF